MAPEPHLDTGADSMFRQSHGEPQVYNKLGLGFVPAICMQRQFRKYQRQQCHNDHVVVDLLGPMTDDHV